MRVLVTGAAGNLGGMLSQYLVHQSDNPLNLLVHNRDVCASLRESSQVSVFRGDLGRRDSLTDCMKYVDVVIHFAGVLFKGKPEAFLPETNTQYFKNLCDVAVESNVRRIVLISFPHVEGETTPDSPAQGCLDETPVSAHATTRLDEEKYLFNVIKPKGIEAISLRVGMVYGRGVLMIDAARWLSKLCLLGVWRKPTWIHLISKDDFLEATKNAIERANISGIYHLGDEGRQTLQDFLNLASSLYGHKPPWIMPQWLINTAAGLCELQSVVFGTRAPLTRDFVKIGMVSYYGNTKRMRDELLRELKYRNIEEGKHTLISDAQK